MLQAFKIDEQGFYLDDIIYYNIENDNENIKVIVDFIDGEEVYKIQPKSNFVFVERPSSNEFYKLKWDGTKWVEGLTQEEIEAIVNAPVEPTQDEILQFDVNAVAETTAYTLEDVIALAETVAILLEQNALLENRIAQLEGGSSQ